MIEIGTYQLNSCGPIMRIYIDDHFILRVSTVRWCIHFAVTAAVHPNIRGDRRVLTLQLEVWAVSLALAIFQRCKELIGNLKIGIDVKCALDGRIAPPDSQEVAASRCWRWTD